MIIVTYLFVERHKPERQGRLNYWYYYSITAFPTLYGITVLHASISHRSVRWNRDEAWVLSLLGILFFQEVFIWICDRFSRAILSSIYNILTTHIEYCPLLLIQCFTHLVLFDQFYSYFGKQNASNISLDAPSKCLGWRSTYHRYLPTNF